MRKNILMIGESDLIMVPYGILINDIGWNYEIATDVVNAKKLIDSREFSGTLLRGLDTLLNKNEKRLKYCLRKSNTEEYFKGGLDVVKYSIKNNMPALVLEKTEPKKILTKARKLGASSLEVGIDLDSENLKSKIREFFTQKD